MITVGEQAENIAKVAINLGMEKKNVNAYMSNSDAINKIKSIISKAISQVPIAVNEPVNSYAP